MSSTFLQKYKKISAEESALISAIQFARRFFHPRHNVRKPPLYCGTAKIQFRRNVNLWELIHKVELRNLFVFPTKIRLIDNGFHILSQETTELRR